MNFNLVEAGADLPNEVNALVEIPAQAAPIFPSRDAVDSTSRLTRLSQPAGSRIMPKVELLHIDDEVLDPTDPSLRTRGAVHVDGHERGSYEEHLDGSWTAWIEGAQLSGGSKQELSDRIAAHCA